MNEEAGIPKARNNDSTVMNTAEALYCGYQKSAIFSLSSESSYLPFGKIVVDAAFPIIQISELVVPCYVVYNCRATFPGSSLETEPYATTKFYLSLSYLS